MRAVQLNRHVRVAWQRQRYLAAPHLRRKRHGPKHAPELLVPGRHPFRREAGLKLIVVHVSATGVLEKAGLKWQRHPAPHWAKHKSQANEIVK